MNLESEHLASNKMILIKFEYDRGAHEIINYCQIAGRLLLLLVATSEPGQPFFPKQGKPLIPTSAASSDVVGNLGYVSVVFTLLLLLLPLSLRYLGPVHT